MLPVFFRLRQNRRRHQEIKHEKVLNYWSQLKQKARADAISHHQAKHINLIARHSAGLIQVVNCKSYEKLNYSLKCNRFTLKPTLDNQKYEIFFVRSSLKLISKKYTWSLFRPIFICFLSATVLWV